MIGSDQSFTGHSGLYNVGAECRSLKLRHGLHIAPLQGFYSRQYWTPRFTSATGASPDLNAVRIMIPGDFIRLSRVYSCLRYLYSFNQIVPTYMICLAWWSCNGPHQ